MLTKLWPEAQKSEGQSGELQMEPFLRIDDRVDWMRRVRS
jgi:hypothetical protein